MSEHVREAAIAVERAERNMSRINKQVRDKIKEAEAAIKSEFADQVSEAKEELRAAEKALSDAKDALPKHEWEGRKVYCLEPQGYAYERRPPKRVEGIVETFTSKTKVPENMSRYSLPAQGQPIVRLLKNDGTPGIKFKHFGRHYGWKLAEDEA